MNVHWEMAALYLSELDEILTAKPGERAEMGMALPQTLALAALAHLLADRAVADDERRLP